MTAEIKFRINRPAFDYPTMVYFVEIRGDDGVRGMFTTLSRHEAEDLVERINEYPKAREELLEAHAELERLKARLRKRKPSKPTRKRKGGAK